MKKKIIAILLVMTLCMTMCIPSFASESDSVSDPVFTGSYAELKASVYQQLKEQDKLEHFELHLEALGIGETETAMDNSRSVNSQSWNAPNGGVLSYTYDWTYRGESGYATNVISYMTPAMTDAYRLGDYHSLGEMIVGITGYVYSQLQKQIPALKSLFTINPGIYGAFIAIDIANLIEGAISESYINQADGYGKLSAVYDSISDASSKVLVGWDSHPTVTLNRSDAYNVSFD